MRIRYVNVAVFIILSLTSYNSGHINIEKDTAPCTADLQERKFFKFLPNGQTVVRNVF